MDYRLTLSNRSNGSPLYFLDGPYKLSKKSSKLKVIANFILENFELEEVEIVSSDDEAINQQAVADLWQVLKNSAREEFCSFSENDIFSDWN